MGKGTPKGGNRVATAGCRGARDPPFQNKRWRFTVEIVCDVSVSMGDHTLQHLLHRPRGVCINPMVPRPPLSDALSWQTVITIQAPWPMS